MNNTENKRKGEDIKSNVLLIKYNLKQKINNVQDNLDIFDIHLNL